MFFVAADHVHLKHCRRPVERKNRMMDVVPASKQPLLFPCPGTQENAACRRNRSIAERFGQFQKRSGTGAVVVSAVPDLSVRLTVVIVVGAYDHDLSLQ